MNYADNISVGGFRTGHVQGIAIDKNREYMYYSFTTCLVKSDLNGRIIGTVNGLAGHLGCIAYNSEDGRVYGSLEYKHDCIGKGILGNMDHVVEVEDGFYIAIFDVDKIDRMDMDAEKDGIMTAVYLKEVFDDYTAPGHRYGCSGIDGTTFAPLPGVSDDKNYLYVAYGVYSDRNRQDNDHQVILRYDIKDWPRYEKPLNQASMHKLGPSRPDSKYFVYTGNTAFGIQNLEYDPVTKLMFAAVYRGEKKQFPNYPMYLIDMTKKAEVNLLKGLNEEGEQLSLADCGEYDSESGIRGDSFGYGSTGMISLGDGYFYFSHPASEDGTHSTTVKLYRYDSANGFTRCGQDAQQHSF
ncbi:MAG: hypothetical protein J6B85_06730 [Lachnospiraceae bacterium]|nr:hypothetical protein [Lachnospiraceae bacterium]